MKITFQSFFNRPFMAITLVMSLFFVTGTARAEIDFSGLYSGFIFSDSTEILKPDTGVNDKYSRGHMKGKLGYIVNDIISFEGQLGLTSNSGGSEGIMTYGGYLRAGKDFGQYKLYGLLGASGIYYYSDAGNISQTGGSYGVGLEIFGSKDLAITLEYITLVDKSIDEGDFSFDTLGIGFTYYFTEEKSYFNRNQNKIKSIRY